MELNKYIHEMCRLGSACFDVGGYLGYDALVLAKISGGGRVASFEAEPERCRLIEEAVAANPAIASRVTVHNVFVGSAPDDKPSLILDEFAYGPAGFVPDMIKMDIEGAEAFALSGASRILSERHPDLIVEVHSAEVEAACIDILRMNRYSPFTVDPRRWLAENRPAGSANRWLIARANR